MYIYAIFIFTLSKLIQITFSHMNELLFRLKVKLNLKKLNQI